MPVSEARTGAEKCRDGAPEGVPAPALSGRRVPDLGAALLNAFWRPVPLLFPKAQPARRSKRARSVG